MRLRLLHCRYLLALAQSHVWRALARKTVPCNGVALLQVLFRSRWVCDLIRVRCIMTSIRTLSHIPSHANPSTYKSLPQHLLSAPPAAVTRTRRALFGRGTPQLTASGESYLASPALSAPGRCELDIFIQLE